MMQVVALALAPALLAWVPAPETPAPEPQPSPAATAPATAPAGAPTPVSAPSLSPAPTSSPLPAPTASPTPIAAPTPAYHFVYTPRPGPTNAAPDAPRIVEVDFTDQTIHTNSDVYLRVLTSPSVALVVISAMGHDAPVPQVAPGVWSAGSHVPSVPFFMLNRTYSVQVRASASDGRSDSVTLPVRLVR